MGGWPTRRAVSFLVSIAETEIRPGFAKAGRCCCARLNFFKAGVIFQAIAKYAGLGVVKEPSKRKRTLRVEIDPEDDAMGDESARQRDVSARCAGAGGTARCTSAGGAE